jgi:two-component system response regulator CpxR
VRVLLIDDDAELCDLLARYLRGEGFDVRLNHDGPSGLESVRRGGFDIALIDVMLPGMNGFDLVRSIRASSDLPILMLTARGDEVDRIVGLELGADDYLPKPFHSRELLARMNAILRRSRSRVSVQPHVGDRLVIGDIDLDISARMTKRGGERIELTSVEFHLLELLLRSAGRVVSREELFRRVLGRREASYDRSLDMHISNLRKKLGHLGGSNERIKTVRGSGYIYAVSSVEGGEGVPPQGAV